ncbi:tRNA (guanosine(46)-N7)-methyltransferase TrmB [Mycoplasmopsis iners]|uniref:tRNA (guanosine(46)-N7)-methyltransferase TrmB n=1 Tax=Mycoplasmopsis iners TaxID=76630 RepID=UPI000495331B|nr:tRNA (guanosine(46)-N7)-methyltransferase TrmB [Mycoplasmopsis iners]
MRLRHDKNAQSKLENSKFYIDPGKYPVKLDSKTVLEIGMGKGEMIVELARINPDLIFIGLEKYATVAAKALKKAEEYNINNFHIIIDDATKLEEIFVGEPHTIWLTFSDPWPKARHERRRLTHSSFLNLYSKIMNENTMLKFKSDNDKLYEFSLESFQQNGWNLVDYGTDLHNSSHQKDNVMTGYEAKWSSLGKNINYIYVKKP